MSNQKPMHSDPVLTVQDGKVTASSRDIARKFGKQHRDVIRAIDLLDCSQEFKVRNFAQLKFTYRGQEFTCYEMTRDGFSLLCMGFTGRKAAIWKEAYIDAFNRMEETLLQEKIWIGGLTQALEHICPTPPTEAEAIRNQRAVKTLRALAAYWAMLEEMPFAAAESAVCAVGRPFSAPPRKISAIVSGGKSVGMAVIFSAINGFPPIAKTSDRLFAAAIAP